MGAGGTYGAFFFLLLFLLSPLPDGLDGDDVVVCDGDASAVPLREGSSKARGVGTFVGDTGVCFVFCDNETGCF